MPLARLTAGFDEWVAVPTDISYPEAGSFVRFLHEHHGREKLKALWQAPRVDWQGVYGTTLAALEAEWLAVLAPVD